MGSLRRPAGRIKAMQIFRLIEEQQFRCALTGWPLTPQTAALDHVVPVCNGGAHDISNAQVLDARVNRAKGTMSVEDFIALCRAVVAHADRPHFPDVNEFDGLQTNQVHNQQ